MENELRIKRIYEWEKGNITNEKMATNTDSYIRLIRNSFPQASK